MNFNPDKLYQVLDDFTKKGLPMYDVIVTQNGERVFRVMGGYRDENKTQSIKGDEQYWMYSCTKVITTAAAMRLVEQGKMSLDDDVAKYLPEYNDIYIWDGNGGVVPAKNKMKIHQLFSMSSGLDYNLYDPNVKAAAVSGAATRDVVKSFVKHPLMFEPGTRWNYSLSHDVLAAVIEVVSGMKFSEYLQKNIFTPLGMENTTFRPTKEQFDRMPQMFSGKTGTVQRVENHNVYILCDTYESGGAGLCSCTEDYAKFLNALASDGSPDGYKILSRQSIDIMRKNRFTDKQLEGYWKKEESGYGLGVYTINKPLKSGVPIGAYGWDGAAASYTCIDVENKLSFIFTTHLLDGFDIIRAEDIRDAAYISMGFGK